MHNIHANESVQNAVASFKVGSTLGSSFRSSIGTTASPISVRTSDNLTRSISFGASEYIVPSGTGNFVAIHKEVGEGIIAMPAYTFGTRRGMVEEMPEDEPIGSLVPLDDTLCSLLLIAGIYLLIRFFRNSKIRINNFVNKTSI